MERWFFISWLALGFLLSINTVSLAEDRIGPGFYLSGQAMYSQLADTDLMFNSSNVGTFDNGKGYGFAASLGYRLPYNVFHNRVEAELAYRRNLVSKMRISTGEMVPVDGHFVSVASMINLYFDFPFNSTFAPYLGGGLGMVHMYTGSVEEDSFAYQVMTGANWNLSPKHTLYGGFRYLKAVDPSFREFGNRWELAYNSRTIEVGYRYHFGGPNKKKQEIIKPASFIEPPTPDEPIAISASEQEIIQRNQKERQAMRMAKERVASKVAKTGKPKKYKIQVGSFSRKENAFKIKYLLQSLHPSEVTTTKNKSGNALYKVTLGEFDNLAKTNQILSSIQEMGYEDAFIVGR